MRDSSQLRAMDDYFHSLLLDEVLLDDAPLLDVAPLPNVAEERKAAPVVPLRLPQAQPEVVAPPYLEVDARLEQLSELLAQVSQVQFELDPPVVVPKEAVVVALPQVAPLPIEVAPTPLPVEPIRVEEIAAPSIAVPSTLLMAKSAPMLAPEPEAAPADWENIDTSHEFQALFFEVAGVTFAVPLTELGGIHQLGEVSTLFGQPAWYRGIMTSREQKMNVVDTAMWVMPGQRLEIPDYQYLIMLGESHWGLACHQLKGTELLHRDQVKWRNQEGKRPWLAGMVKEKMCALLHVKELLLLLERGVNIEGR